MRIEGTYRTPMHGVSTLAPRNRADGQAGKQVNFRSDPVRKLTRRPSMVWKADLMEAKAGHEYTYHEYTKETTKFRIIVDITDGEVFCFKDNILLEQSTVAATYLAGGKVSMKTIENTTYLLNQEVKTRRGTSLDDYNRVTHINVISALNYGETVTVGIGSVGDSPATTVSYSVPDLGTTEPDYDTADKARATKAVATGIASELNQQSWFNSNYKAITQGSSVGIYHKTDPTQWVDAYVTSGQGERSLVVINRQVENVEGLPLYSVHGTRIIVKPNPTSDKGTYYLQAERTNEPPTVPPADFFLEEVVWAETRSPVEPYDIQAGTLPHTVVYDDDTGDFTVSEGTWKGRRTGDDDSCPAPDFLDHQIIDIGHFQNRLVFIAKGNVFMTETDDYENWWKASAVKLLVTDPIGIGSNAVDTEEIDHISSHNKDLLLVSSNGQFKIVGDEAVTPQSVSMPKVSAFECQTSVAPVPMGASVMLAIQQGQSGGLLDYTTKAASEQEMAQNVSRHVVGYMKGNVTRLVGSVNSDILAMTTDGSANNVLYIYEQYDERGEIMQNAWSEWQLPTDVDIVDLSFRASKLTVITKHDGRVAVQEIDLYSSVATNTDEVFLDYMLTLTSADGSRVTLPDNYTPKAGTIAVRGFGTDYTLWKALYDIDGQDLVFKENLSGGQPCEVYIGVPIPVSYVPTRPFRREESGMVVTTDRIRVARWTISVVETYSVAMKIHSEFVQLDDQEFSGRIMGTNSNIIGERSSYTGDLHFSYAQDASLAEAEFYDDGYLGLTIAGISWNGQYYRTSGRL